MTDNALMHEALEMVTERILASLREVLRRPLDTIVRIGGCEQCTPPMMPPGGFAEFITPYEKRIASFVKEQGYPLYCHCHGRVRNVLNDLIEIGYDATEPVEPPFGSGGGDVSMQEARDIVGDRLTLCGNFQFEELERSEPEQVRARVREILATGRRRLILTASATPIARMSPRMIRSYYAWIDEAVNCAE